MTPNEPHRLLWVDDDAPDRFVYEAYLVQQAGWSLTWATDVLSAAQLLCEQPFDGLILDQTFAFEPPGGRRLDPQYQLWSGCFLLRWLRGAGVPEHAPWLSHEDEQRLWGQTPLAQNRTLPAIIASAFHADEVERAIRSASDQDRQIELVAKPLSEVALLDFLEAVIG